MYWKVRGCFQKLKIIGSCAKFGSKFGLGSRRIVNQIQFKMRYVMKSFFIIQSGRFTDQIETKSGRSA